MNPELDGMDGWTAAVITCSTRAAAGIYPDETGPVIVKTLRSWGLSVKDSTVVADGPTVAEAIRAALDAGADLVVTTGGTGMAPGDSTPEHTRSLLDLEIPGIPEAMRAQGVAAGVPTAVLSREVAGVAVSHGRAGRSLVVNLPGSQGGVKDGLNVLNSVVAHALEQLLGGDHQRITTS